MERVIDVRLRIHYEPRFFRPWIAAGLFFLTAGEVASENVTLSTYYPAPSGVYTQLVTTGQTILARDGGNVGVGTASPAAKLDVAGQANVQKLVTTGNNVYNTADPMAADVVTGSSAGSRHNSSIMFWSAASASRLYNQSDVFYLSVWNSDAVGGANVRLAATYGGSSMIHGNVSVGSNLPAATARGYLYIDNSNTGCWEADVTQGPVCGGGYYASWRPGLYIEGWDYANRGGQVVVEAGVGQDSSQVWGLNNCSISGVGCTGNARWMTLRKNDSVAHIFCCPK